MIKIALLVIALASGGHQWLEGAEARMAHFKGTFAKLLYADCDTPDPGDPDSFE